MSSRLLRPIIRKLSRTAMANSDSFLYFAYGSNLSSDRIRISNPSAVAVGVARLKAYALDFDYHSKVDLWKNDTAESGNQVTAFTYQLHPERCQSTGDQKRPSKVYMNVILRGAREHGMPDFYIEKLESIEHNGYDGQVEVNLPLHLIK